MDAYCLIGCYRELLRRIEAVSDPNLREKFMRRFQDTVNIPKGRITPVRKAECHFRLSGLSIPSDCSAEFVREKIALLPPIEVVNEWSGVTPMVEQLRQEPFFSFAIQPSVGGRGKNYTG